MALRRTSRDEAHPSKQQIADYLSLHGRYSELLAQFGPNVTTVSRQLVTEASLSAMSRAAFEQSRTDLVEQIAWLDTELSDLQRLGAYVQTSAQKRTDIQRLASEFAKSLEFLIEFYSDNPQRPKWKELLEWARSLCSEAKVRSLTLEQADRDYAILQAWAADRKKQAAR